MENTESGVVQGVYTPEQIATILNMSKRTAYDYCAKTTDFVVHRIGPKLIRIHKASFDNWFNGLGNQAKGDSE